MQRIKKLYDKTLRLAKHKNATGYLVGGAFLEGFIFPIPPDVLLIPMILAQREKAFRLALFATAASVAGGVVGYGLGAIAFHTVGAWIVSLYGYTQSYQDFATLYTSYGQAIVLVGSFTPFPYKIIAVLAGVTSMSLTTFMVYSFIARGARFFLLAWILWRFGTQVERFIERYFNILTLLFTVLLLGGFAWAYVL